MTDAETSGMPGRFPQASFGVGCWDFGVQCQRPSKFQVNEYVARLTKGLEAVSSLNNLKIETELDDDATIGPENAKDTNGRPAVFSHGIVWNLEFDLYIPFRIQNELGASDAQSQTKTERFRVHVRHAYHDAVAFVELVGAKAPPAPSTAMAVLRNYLKKESQKSTCDLAFEFVGPTPFHANFYVEAFTVPNERGKNFGIKRQDSPGYSDITFSYCKSSFPTVQAALGELFDELREELGLFYRICRDNSESYKRWAHIERLMEHLTSRPAQLSWLQHIRRARDLEEMSIAIAEFEADQISEEHGTRKAFRGVYRGAASAFLKGYVEAELEERPEFPTKPITELLAFIERRRSKALELLVVLGAAVVGGVTGALLTMLAND